MGEFIQFSSKSLLSIRSQIILKTDSNIQIHIDHLEGSQIVGCRIWLFSMKVTKKKKDSNSCIIYIYLNFENLPSKLKPQKKSFRVM